MKVPPIGDKEAKQEAYLQSMLVLKGQDEHKKRLDNVAYSILKSNAELCGDKSKLRIGITSVTLEHFDEGWQEIIHKERGIGNHITITAIAEGSPAQDAGLAPGDEILGLNGNSLGVGKKAQKKFSKLFRKYTDSFGFVTLNMSHQGRKQDVDVFPVLHCDYSVHLISSSTVNA